MALTTAAGDEADIITQMAHGEQLPYMQTLLHAF